MTSISSYLSQLMQDLSVTSTPNNVGALDAFLQPSRRSRIQNLTAFNIALQRAGFVYITIRDAISSLRQRRLLDFDALVGDCACHIRALFIAHFATKYFSSPSAHTELCAIQRTISRQIAIIKRKLRSPQTIPANLTGQDVLNPLEREIPQQLIYMAMAYLLTKTRENKSVTRQCTACLQLIKGCHTEATNSNFASTSELAISKEHTSRLVLAVKKTFSRLSCEYIQQEALGLPSLTSLEQRLLTAQHTNAYSRHELPCFVSKQIAFKSAIKRGFSILVKVQRAEHNIRRYNEPYDVVFCLQPIDGALRRVIPTASHAQQPFIVIEGQRNAALLGDETSDQYCSRLMGVDMMDIITWNGAAHPQYTEDNIALPLTDLELQPLRALALRADQEGCSFQNQRLLFMTHIYTDTLINQYQELGINTLPANGVI